MIIEVENQNRILESLKRKKSRKPEKYIAPKNDEDRLKKLINYLSYVVDHEDTAMLSSKDCKLLLDELHKV